MQGFNISIMGAVGAIRDSYVVMAVYDSGLSMIYCGAHTLPDAVEMRGISLPADQIIAMRVLSIHATMGEAKQAVSGVLRDAGVPPVNRAMLMRREVIQCVETGETWNSAADCVRDHECNQSALSNHLAGRPGFKTVKGRKYIRISVDNRNESL